MNVSFNASSVLFSPFKPTSTHRTKPSCQVRAQLTEPIKANVVIVGAGISGLATALSLQRSGVGSLVLERADAIQTGGTSLTLFRNAWRVLDNLGIGDELRSQFLEIQGIQIYSNDGRSLRSFRMKEEDPGQEARAVERKVMLETMACKLPENSIRFNSKLESLETCGNGETLIRLADGSRVLAKIVIGSDGARSSVAKWMGFPETKYTGQRAYRGLSSFPNGQPFDPVMHYVYGRGIRGGYVPVTSNKVFWIICHNSETPGKKQTDPNVLKEEATEFVKGWPKEFKDLIERSEDDTISRAPLGERLVWPIGRPGWKENVVLVGDAWHPMTPNLGQGACCALEDAVVLTRNLAETIKKGEKVEKAFRTYESERRKRIFSLALRSNLVGSLLQWDNEMVCNWRDSVMIPKVVSLRPMLAHTNVEF